MVNPIKTSAVFYRPSAITGRHVEKAPKQMSIVPEDRKRCMFAEYTNWRGETRIRELKPIEIEWGCTEWHPIHQWLLKAKDMEDGKVKHFAMNGFRSMTAVKT